MGGEEFVHQLQGKIGKRRNYLHITIGSLMVAGFILFVIFSSPLQLLAMQLSTVLTMPLVDLGGSAIAWAISPINNIATVTVLFLKMLRVTWKRSVNAYYAY